MPLVEQDRSLWNQDAIREGTALVQHALCAAQVGPYQLQAAIAAVHDEAPRVEDTDWEEILGLYELLQNVAPGPMVRLSRIVAVAMVHGPQHALAELARAEQDPASPGITACPRCARTCSTWQATAPVHVSSTGWPRDERSANRNAGTSSPARDRDAQMRDQASVSTERRICSISSKCC